LNNFFSSTDIPTLFLDRAFNVRRFTPAMTGLIKLIPSDAGRSISDISIAGLGADLLADARAVLDRSSPLSREIPMDGAWYIRSTLPYKTGRNRIDGVVITFVDITGRKEIELELQKRQIELDSRFNSSKRSAEELKTINEELFRFNRVAVDRELRMIELKGEVNELNNLAGQKPRYNLDFAENLTDIPSTLKGIK
jgi:hypothetical protein